MSFDGELATLRQQVENFQNLNALVREQLERTNKENSTLADDNNFLRKKNYSLQQEIISNHNAYTRIESELYQQGQEAEELKKKKENFLKNKEEVERKLREETEFFEKDQLEWQKRESELTNQIKALQESANALRQQNDASKKRNGSTSSSNDEDSPPSSPTTPTGSASSYYTAVREVKVAKKTIKELERRVNELVTEVENVERMHVNSMNLNKEHVTRIHYLENELGQVKHINQTLMEDSERYRQLLHEKTMKGEFVLDNIMQRNAKHTYIAGNFTNKDDAIVNIKSMAIDLEAELNRATHKGCDNKIIEKLQDEIKALKDSNKSMSLYINKILNRIMEAQGFEEILSKDWTAKKETSLPLPTNSLSPEPVKKKTGRRKTFSFGYGRRT
ncbi:m protein, serotype 2.1 precursor [Gigaspora margarita]|uniref:M protein, serotype 2.1 n=1 Tax=Gigaspora margarita TaxID=4874 RepID=A0A8H4AF10_GIGMA|nr:m protein, serotype 2.1 precursor [Gigaspora margarita]